MSRSYYEWIAAKHKWYVEQKNIVASIPYPSETLEYPVVYKRESNNSFWERRRESALSLIPETIDFNFTLEKVIKSTRDIEFKKEQEFLDKFYHGDSGSHIEKFNILFQSKELYTEFNNKIQNIINVKSNEKNTSKGATHEYFTGLAPNLNSVFMTYFMPAFEEILPELYKSIRPTMTIDELQEELYGYVQKATIAASTEMAKIAQQNDNGQGWGNEWRPILEMISGNDRASRMLNETIIEAIGPNLFKEFELELQKQKAQKKKLSAAALKKIATESLGNVRGRKASIGGSILEPVIALFAEYFNGKNESFDYQMAALNFGGNKVMTDVAMLFSTKTELDLQNILDQLKDAMNTGSSNTMREVYQKIQDFYKKEHIQENLDELYQVFVNAKNYSIGADARNYTKTEKGDLEELPALLSANGISIENARSFLLFAYNTGKGAVREHKRIQLQEDLQNALKVAAANMMFDDYQEIGRGSTHSIHMYYLSGKYVPASVVFGAILNALEDTHSALEVNVELPPPIDDQGPEWRTEDDTKESNADLKKRIYEHWKEEAKQAKYMSRWSASFTL